MLLSFWYLSVYCTMLYVYVYFFYIYNYIMYSIWWRYIKSCHVNKILLCYNGAHVLMWYAFFIQSDPQVERINQDVQGTETGKEMTAIKCINVNNAVSNWKTNQIYRCFVRKEMHSSSLLVIHNVLRWVTQNVNKNFVYKKTLHRAFLTIKRQTSQMYFVLLIVYILRTWCNPPIFGC